MESKIRIGLLVDYLESEYSDSLIKGLSTFCKTKGISLYIFFVGEIKNVDTTFNYQYVAAASFITQNNLDGVVITSGGQFHSFTKEELVSYLKKYFSLPLVNISSQLPQIPSLVVDCKDAFSELIKFLIERKNKKYTRKDKNRSKLICLDCMKKSISPIEARVTDMAPL